MRSTVNPQSDHGSANQALLFFAACRPHLMLPAWLCAATGITLARYPASTLTHPTVVLSCLGWSGLLAAVHLVNLIADQTTDQLNAKNLFWQGHLTARKLTIGAAGLCLCGLGLLAYVSPRLLLPAGLSLSLGLAYSAPPLRLSSRWGWDLLANALGYGFMAPWLGGLSASIGVSADTWALPGLSALYLLPMVSVGFLWTTTLDRHGDQATGKRTWAVRWGQRQTLWMALGVSLSATLPRFARELNRSSVDKDSLIWPGLVVVGLAMATLFITGTTQRKTTIVAIFGSVLLAGWPALWAHPVLSLFCVGWLALSYAVLVRVNRS